MRLARDNQGRSTIFVSRTNLLTLLAKLDGYPPGSGCTIEGGQEAAGIRITVEEDDVHYANRNRGLMHPMTEAEVMRRRNFA